MSASNSCAVCHYPIKEAFQIGQQVKCPYCSTINEAIAQEGITIPTPLFVGITCFVGGMLLGPAVLGSFEGGQRWLERQVRERIK